jgi:2-amino-4-hydroxy-6-hydroxymethyldihydropteridine diphosphokinase
MKVYLSLGSNLGDRKKYLKRAEKLLSELAGVRLTRSSNMLETKPYGYIDQPDFINMVLEIETELAAGDLMARCLDIEAALGRKREQKWGIRTIDIDILFYGELVISEADLKIPHPDLANREFVLRSMVELEPEFVHPVMQKTMSELYKKLPGGKI